jgi:type VI protein secretion system component VasF
MTAIFSTSIRSPSAAPLPDERRGQLQRAIRDHEAQAQQAAEQGDLVQAARFILAALDSERRMASTGPQVLQLIKPRG